MNPILLIDFYKAGHINQYPQDCTQVWSNWTPRTTRVEGKHRVVNAGLTYLCKEYLINQFNENFFKRPLMDVVGEYRDVIKSCLFVPDPRTDHIEALHKLGYLPICIYSLPEGFSVRLNVPPIIITNTHPDFFWLPNYFETLLSMVLWKISTSATTAQRFRKVFTKWALTADESNLGFIDWQGHDFSMRGMSGLEDAILSGMGHLMSFSGTDTVPAILAAKKYYGADLSCGGSVPATEHSVMSSWGQENERETFRRLIEDVYPHGIVSIVSDTWDLWSVLTDYIPSMRDKLLARDGKLVVRPDSGDPVKIELGDPAYESVAHSYNCDKHPAAYGTLALLAKHMGTIPGGGRLPMINKAASIYGDSITVERADDILGGMVNDLKLSPFNMVFGIGSYCVVPSTPILCSDLSWRRADSLEIGQEILAFEENPKFGQEQGRKAARRYQTAQITANHRAAKPCSIISTDIGPSVTASDDHPWLVWVKNRNVSNTYTDGRKPRRGSQTPRSAGLAWKTTKELVIGDRIAFLASPWERENTRSSGWLAGVFDGEGSISKSTGSRLPSYKINISQNPGRVLDRIKAEVSTRGFSFYENKRECPQVVITGGFPEFLRFIGTIAPDRILAKLPTVIAQLPSLFRGKTYNLAEVTSVVSVGTKPVASISTSCGTFITAGYLSHNTYEYVTRDTYGWAMKATAVRRGNTVIPIFKKPVTDNGGKFSHRGILAAYRTEESTDSRPDHFIVQEATEDQLNNCAYEKVFVNGELLVDPGFAKIRERVRTI